MTSAQITTKTCWSYPSREIARCRSSKKTTKTLKWHPHLRCTSKIFLRKTPTTIRPSMMRPRWTRQQRMPHLPAPSNNWARWAFLTARATPTSWSRDGSRRVKWSRRSTKTILLRNIRSSMATGISSPVWSTSIRPSIPKAATSESGPSRKPSPSETTSIRNSRKSKTRSCHWHKKWVMFSQKSWRSLSLSRNWIDRTPSKSYSTSTLRRTTRSRPFS